MNSLFHNRDYRILLGGQIVSDLGTWISQLAYPLLFLSITGSPLQAGLSIALTNLPTFLFGIPAGVMIDTFNRKQLMIACDLLRFVILGSIPLALYLGNLTTIHLYLAALLSGICDVIFSTAEQTAVVRVVPKEQLTRAFGQYEASANTASLIGPTVGGALYQIGQGLPFLVDALSYVLSAISFLFIKSEFQETDRKKSIGFREAGQGATWLLNHSTVRPIAFVRAFGALVSGGQTLLLILLAKEFGASPVIIGVIVSVGSIGVVLGSLISDSVQKRLGTYRALIWSRWVIALALLFQLLSPNIVYLTLAVTLSYFSVAVYGTIATAYRLKLVPDELQGRVNGFHRMLVFGGLAIGGVLTGFLVEHVTIRTTFLIYCVLLAVLTIILTIVLSQTKEKAP